MELNQFLLILAVFTAGLKKELFDFFASAKFIIDVVLVFLLTVNIISHLFLVFLLLTLNN